MKPGTNRRDFFRALTAAALPLKAQASAFWNPGKRLLLDPRVVEKAEGARLVIGTVEKDIHNPLFKEDRGWEIKFDNLYANVMFDEGERLYKCWYNPFIRYSQYESTPRERRPFVDYSKLPRDEPEMGVCYATSRDGIVWNKPELGLVDYNGSRNNNILLRNREAPSNWQPHGSGIWKDLRDPDASRRYKIFFSRPHKEMCVAFSGDGIHWSEPVPCPEIASRGDTHNNTFWAPSLNRYVGITRNFDDRERTRLVARTESEDFLHWTKAVEALRHLPSEPERQTYAMPVFPYANGYLGLVMMLNRGDQIVKTDPVNDTVDCELTWSADTVHWQRVCPGSPLIPRGPEGSHDGGCLYAAACPIERDGQLRLYYGSNNGKHSDWRDGFFCLARLRADGFAGMEASGSGFVVTRPVEWQEAGMRIAAAAARGSVIAKVLDGDRVAAESYPLTGNLSDAAVRWKTAVPAGMKAKPIRLRFELKSAKLYSFTLS